MTNTKNTKRALLSSVLALLLCFTMLLGTTFAWFTDSVLQILGNTWFGLVLCFIIATLSVVN